MKKITDIDRSLIINTDITEQDIIWVDIKQEPFVISGISYDESIGCYVRMPQEIADQVSEDVKKLNRQSAGGRVRFRSNSSFIGIYAVMNNVGPWARMSLMGISGFDLYRKVAGEGEERFYHSFIPPEVMETGYSSSLITDGKLAEYTINFPSCDVVNGLYIALKKDAVILEPTPYSHEIPLVYYGSSITQGICASRPGNSYQAIISRRLNADYVNLGFSGSCRAEERMIQYLAELKMSVFICDYDHNTPDAEYLKKTHLPLYRIIRLKQPKLPIIFVSAPTIRLAPGGSADAFAARREVIRETYLTALGEGDENVYFIDGAELFDGDDWDSCTVDGIHPNDLGFYRMALRIEKEIVHCL